MPDPPRVQRLVIATQSALLPTPDHLENSFSTPQPATIEACIQTGLITAVHTEFREQSNYGSDCQYVCVPQGCLLFPGLIDAHVHLNEPGRTAWEGFATGTDVRQYALLGS